MQASLSFSTILYYQLSYTPAPLFAVLQTFLCKTCFVIRNAYGLRGCHNTNHATELRKPQHHQYNTTN